MCVIGWLPFKVHPGPNEGQSFQHAESGMQLPGMIGMEYENSVPSWTATSKHM